MLIEIDSLSHDCCGEELSRGKQVTLLCRRPGADVVRPVDLVADNHSGLLPFINCSGEVVDITMTDDSGVPQPIQRLPSGRALTGNDGADDGTIRSADTGQVVDRYGPRHFYVTMESVTRSEIDEEAWAAMMRPKKD